MTILLVAYLIGAVVFTIVKYNSSGNDKYRFIPPYDRTIRAISSVMLGLTWPYLAPVQFFYRLNEKHSTQIKAIMFGFFKKKKSKQNKSKIQHLIEERGYEQAVALLAGSIIERLPNRVAAYEFMLQELDGASMGNEDSKKAAANSGIPPGHYKGALNKDVPAIESAQDNITNYSFQLADDQELMARLRVDIGVEVMKHFEFGRFTP